MYKVAVCGNFGADDGQTVKTKNLLAGLKDQYGSENVTFLDTNSFKKNPAKFIYKCFRTLKETKNVILIFGLNGLKYMVPLFFRINKLCKASLHYVAIGGWTDQVLKKNKTVKQSLQGFNNVFVETEVSKRKLEMLNMNNVHILNNFKDLQPVSIENTKVFPNEPYPLVIFSRIIEKKGIAEAIEAVKFANRKKNIFTLDIYGPIGTDYQKDFESLLNDSPKYISYKGIINAENSVNILKNYYYLLFPTKFITEGIPGTIIDAYMSAVPVIASKWEAAEEIVIDGKTGFLFEFGNQEKFNQLLDTVASNKKNHHILQENALAFSEKYQKEYVINLLGEYLQ